MNAPTIFQQLVIAVVGIASLPLVVALLVKIHLLPLSVYLLAVNSFPAWAQQRQTGCIVALILCIAYPALMWGAKLYRRWQEERYWRGYLLATARKLNRVENIAEERPGQWDCNDDYDY